MIIKINTFVYTVYSDVESTCNPIIDINLVFSGHGSEIFM